MLCWRLDEARQQGSYFIRDEHTISHRPQNPGTRRPCPKSEMKHTLGEKKKKTSSIRKIKKSLSKYNDTCSKWCLGGGGVFNCGDSCLIPGIQRMMQENEQLKYVTYISLLHISYFYENKHTLMKSEIIIT